MKNLLFSLLGIVLFASNVNAQEIEKSTAILTQGRVIVKGSTEKSARSFLLLNFDKNNKILAEYNVDGHLYVDNGEKNDLKAGDGIYTSTDLFPNPKKTNVSYLMKSDSFMYQKELESLSNNKVGISVGCKIRHVRSGHTTIFGLDCAHVLGGCIEFYDCEVSLELEW